MDNLDIFSTSLSPYYQNSFFSKVEFLFSALGFMKSRNMCKLCHKLKNANNLHEPTWSWQNESWCNAIFLSLLGRRLITLYDPTQCAGPLSLADHNTNTNTKYKYSRGKALLVLGALPLKCCFTPVSSSGFAVKCILYRAIKFDDKVHSVCHSHYVTYSMSHTLCHIYRVIYRDCNLWHIEKRLNGIFKN